MCPHDDVETIRFRMVPIFGLPGAESVHESFRCRDCGDFLSSLVRPVGLFDNLEVDNGDE